MGNSYSCLWEFRVAAESVESFERHYGPHGTWAALFRRSPGYIETLLLSDRAAPGRYLTIDRWQDEEAYSGFRRQFGADYAALDSECEALTIEETFIGAFRES
ncbi:MAG: hypothetical protein A3E01_17710 [Gammaproteobacteria bacterium RIFCSPHIGHO2_12_FULL_63_22]|nr:MAG: hypothetical protein A3E01_17710 [Gammaproteobacteria bacterium RIFCSPHIGHO2_12_FULL_63_22]